MLVLVALRYLFSRWSVAPNLTGVSFSLVFSLDNQLITFRGWFAAEIAELFVWYMSRIIEFSADCPSNQIIMIARSLYYLVNVQLTVPVRYLSADLQMAYPQYTSLKVS